MNEENTQDGFDLEQALLAEIRNASSPKSRDTYRKLLDIYYGLEECTRGMEKMEIELGDIEKQIALLASEGESGTIGTDPVSRDTPRTPESSDG